MRHFSTEAVVIKRKNYKEADRIITVFSKNNGKMSLKATGVRKITSRRSPHIEPLNYCRLTFYLAHNYPVLTEVESINTFASIKQDLNKIGIAYHICELIDGLCPDNQEQEAVFSLLKNTLNRLEQEKDLLLLTHEFEVELLTLLGFWRATPQMATRINTQSFIEDILEKKLKSKRIFLKLS